MSCLRTLAVTAAAAAMAAALPSANAQVSVSIGAAPVCPYGYYDYAPYSCAPYGYYGPEWFSGGVFIGAGPWFHGPAGFHGGVNNKYDPHHGYKGAYPQKTEKFRTPPAHFSGNEMRDGQGHEVHAEDHGHH